MTVLPYKITDDDKKRFDRDGYWISPKLIDDETIEGLRKAHDRIWTGDYDGDAYPMNPYKQAANPLALRKLDNGWWINDEVRDFVTDRSLGEMTADLLEADGVRLWHDQVIYKPGTGGEVLNVGNVGWHQDYGYWKCSSTTNMITVWIALQDTDIHNGCMSTILGSHRGGIVDGSNTFFDQDLDGLRSKYKEGGREWVEEPCIMKAGQASFHHALTFHGSGPNTSDSPRLSIVAHLMPNGTLYKPSGGRHDNIRLLGPRPKDGQPFEGEYFPLLYSRHQNG